MGSTQTSGQGAAEPSRPTGPGCHMQGFLPTPSFAGFSCTIRTKGGPGAGYRVLAKPAKTLAASLREELMFSQLW